MYDIKEPSRQCEINIKSEMFSFPHFYYYLDIFFEISLKDSMR